MEIFSMNTIIILGQFLGLIFGVFSLFWLFMPPIVKTERLLSNATNTFFVITMNVGYIGPYVSGTFAQELYEMRLKRRHPIKRLRWESKNLKKKAKSLGFMQELEIVGHAVDVVEAVRIGGDFEERIADEMFIMPLYEQFQGVPSDEIERRLRAAIPEATKWLSKHSKAVVRQRYRNQPSPL